MINLNYEFLWDIVTILQLCVFSYKKVCQNNKCNDYTNLLKAAIVKTSLCDVADNLK